MKLTICGADISAFVIVLPQMPAPAEKTAAAFLQRVFKSACGAELAIVSAPAARSIFIGGSRDLDGIRWDGFRIQTGETHLYLYGRLARGTLYAAYGFAEQFLGYRSFAPDTEVIPCGGSASVPPNFCKTDNPAFELRENDWIGHTAFPEFASRARTNGNFTAARGEEYGGVITALGGCHTFEGLCPPEQNFDAHPAYYSLWEGERIPAGNVFDRPVGQLCLSNPDVLKIVTENALERLRANPGAEILDISQNDNGRYCRCETCAAIDAEEGSPSGLLLRFVNAVAEAVEREFPNVLVQTFAYQYTRKAPRLTRPRKNVVIRYCTIEACFRHALADESCERNAGKFAAELAEWRAICDKISIWDYVTNYRYYIAPFPNFEVLRRNACFFAENHAIHLFEEDTPGTWSGEFGDLKAYLIGKLLWDPYMSEEAYQTHIDEFLQAYYGPGWEHIRRYLRLEADATRGRHMGCFEYMDTGSMCEGEVAAGDYEPQAYQEPYPDSYLSGLIERIGEAKALWDGALAAAASDAQRMHVERSRLPLTYLDLFCTPHDREAMSAEARAAYEAAVEKYHADKRRFGFHTNIWTQRYRGR